MAELFAKATCTYCQEDLSGLRVKCAECPDFELCLQCFSAGAEIGSHKSEHGYQFCNADAGAVGVTFGRAGWSPREELHLLDAVEVYGFGNWEDISKHIETKSPEEAKEQYMSRYLDGTIGRLTWPPALSLRPTLGDSAPAPSPPSPSTRLPPVDVSAEEAKQLYYMPLRDDFESEFENEAELLLAPLCTEGTEDSGLDIALTLVQVDMYVQKLRERSRRKRVARDYQLVSNFFNGTTRKEKASMKKKLTKEEKEFQEGMKVFSQFHTASEHEQFLQNMQREQELKVRLSELQRYRKHGITRHEECSHLEMLLLSQQPHTPSPAGSCGANQNLQAISPHYQPVQLSPFFRKKGKSEETVWCSTEKKCILGNLGVAGYRGTAGGPGGLAVGDATPLLSSQEVALCATLSISPSEYLALKAVIIKEGDTDLSGSESGIERTVQAYLTHQNLVPYRP